MLSLFDIGFHKIFNGGFNFLHVNGWLKSRDEVAFTINQKLGEIPHDICLITKLLVILVGKRLEHKSFGAVSKTLKGKRRGKTHKEGICGFTIDVNFFELGNSVPNFMVQN